MNKSSQLQLASALKSPTNPNPFYIQSSSTSPFSSPLPKPIQKLVRRQMKPCEKYGLDPSKLQNQQLLKHRCYRRLYNIVANDQTEANQVFRPNLIKELYFLLQITPFIQNSLRDGFLAKIQDWYNSNDHKKIKLSKNLDGLIKNVIHEKNNKQNVQKDGDKTIKRPKTGIQWDTSLVSFLRPYTAKLRSSVSSQHRNKQSQQRSYRRPQSSKFGASTNDNTKYYKQKSRINHLSNENDQLQLENVQFLSKNQNIEEERSKCDIQQEWERSLDFKKKYRTMHPQQQPTYEKLMNLILQLRVNDSNTQKDKKNLIKQQKRKIQSAITAKQTLNARNLAQKQLNVKNNEILDDQNIIQDFGKDNDDSCNDSDVYIQPQQEDVINLQQKNKNFISDKRSKQGIRLYNSNNKNHMYEMLNGVKILRPFTAKQSNIISKLDQYSSMEQNKHVIQTKIDEQCAEKYKEYVKNKNKIKRQIIRRSQSKRYMQNFKNVVKILPNKPKANLLAQKQKQNQENKGKNIQHLQPNIFQSNSLKDSQNNQKQIKKQSQESVFDFNLMFNSQNQYISAPKESTYNVKKYFQPLKKQIVSASYRGINKLDVQPNIQVIQTHSKMTNPKRLLSEQKFDPLHKNNLQIYNKEALEEIQRIKEKIGGKITASTESLLKALYIDAPLPVFQDKNNKTRGEMSQFKIPDKCYLMIQKQQKKKRRKLKKKMVHKSSQKTRK